MGVCLCCYKTITVTAANRTAVTTRSYQLTKVAPDMFLVFHAVGVKTDESCAILCAKYSDNLCRAFQVMTGPTCNLGSLESAQTTMAEASLVFVDHTGYILYSNLECIVTQGLGIGIDFSFAW